MNFYANEIEKLLVFLVVVVAVVDMMFFLVARKMAYQSFLYVNSCTGKESWNQCKCQYYKPGH